MPQIIVRVAMSPLRLLPPSRGRHPSDDAVSAMYGAHAGPHWIRGAKVAGW